MLKNKSKKISAKILIINILTMILIVTNAKTYYAKAINNYERDISWLTESPIAHRGLHNTIYPENSISSFKNAIKNGYPIEIDVHFTKDKQVVVVHDDNLERLTGISIKVKDITYNELRNFKLSNSSESIPLFKDVLKLINNQVPILIEIKNCENTIALSNEVNKILNGYTGRYAIQSFDPNVISWYSKNAPEIKKGILINDINKEENLKSYNKIISNATDKADFISISVDSLEDEKIQGLRKMGYPIISWTINNEEMRLKAEKYSDNYIFENLRA